MSDFNKIKKKHVRSHPMIERIKLAVRSARYGSELYPTWNFSINRREKVLEIQAPGSAIKAQWVFGEGDDFVTDEKLRLAVDMLVVSYIQNVKATTGKYIGAPEA